MENNRLKEIWKKAGPLATPESKDALNRILESKTNKIMSRFSYYIGFSALISTGFLAFLIITMVNRRGDPLYMVNNLLICLFTLFAVYSSVRALMFFNTGKTELPLKDWLSYRITSLSKWINSKVVYYVAPFICTLTIFSIHVYYGHKPFLVVFYAEESLIGLAAGLIAGLIVVFITLKKIKKHHRKNLGYLKDLYKQITDPDSLPG